jgi:hypothetical protein
MMNARPLAKATELQAPHQEAQGCADDAVSRGWWVGAVSRARNCAGMVQVASSAVVLVIKCGQRGGHLQRHHNIRTPSQHQQQQLQQHFNRNTTLLPFTLVLT